ncbi:IS982 family transposase [Methylophaga nitratireducenticrescens]|uniref:Transposase, IS982 family n=1 Tax=Methylophaga nitratireducenticrescens TaxID=754476 RepID=I1XNA7_METNJ|nr:IS982 family transposase [Methylophaga nitratireducenticrescens]AFI85876.1 IS982 family transposase [Methylophaga nitratireducenticrescens]AUZ85582.1 IS982 family transposase [Methylophaga nitratireducenticrescens]
MDKLVEIFCDVDDFCRVFIPEWEKTLLQSGQRQRRRQGRMTPAEIMTIIIEFHRSNYRKFKSFYLHHVARHLRDAFPELLSYTRFLEVMPGVLMPLCAYFTHLKGSATGIAFVDSTSIKVCHNLRIPRHKVFDGVATRGKSTMGWFYGFKLHLLINHRGDILDTKLTPANVDDREPVPTMVKGLFGKLYADKGYISQALSGKLYDQGIELITNVRKNMKPKLLSLWDRILLKKRFIIETINDQLKNISQIEHSRHRSLHGFMLNLMGGLIAYCLKEDKPSIMLSEQDMNSLHRLALTSA